jgi:hypothetical protein
MVPTQSQENLTSWNIAKALLFYWLKTRPAR